MTVTVTNARKDYTGNGSTTDFTFDFKIFDEADLKVQLILIASGAVTDQVLDTDYTVSFSSEGGTVSFVTAPASTYDILITRQLDETLVQSNSFVAGTALSSQGLESILDKLTAAIQDMREELDRCIKVPPNQDYNTNMELPAGFNTAGYGVIVNDTADGFSTTNLSSSGTGLDNIVEDTTPQLGGNLDGQSFELQDVKLDTYSETHSSIASSSGTLTIDLSTGRSFSTTLTENVTTVTISNVPSGVNVGFKLFVTQDSTARTITWPGSVIWDGGTAPSISTVSSKHLICFETYDGGTTWNGVHAMANLA